MKSLKTSLSTQLAAYAVGAVAVTGVAATTSNAAVIFVDPPDIAVPQNSTGIYIDLATGITSTTGSFTGYDVNFYGSTTLTFFKPSTTSFIGATTTTAPLALPTGTPITAASIYTTSSASTNFQVTGTEILGVRFNNTTTGATNYGWIELSTTATTGYPAAITRYAFENTGLGILAGTQIAVVPEPGTVAAVGLGLGALGLRAWRRRKQVA